MARRILLPLTWWQTVRVPIYELSSFLTETEYEQMEGIFHEDIKVKLAFEYSPADPDVGIPFPDWSYIGEYELVETDNKIIYEAVGDYLASIDVGLFYGEEAFDDYCEYCEYQKYGSI